uniref:Mannosyltransferase n=1 Tax=Rhabditophanes sp. KR3021 TaxID=114890 RepID=A0AC35TX81_9BILA
MLMMYVSARNYAGGDALAYLQHMQRFDKHKNISVHIDEYAAQTGISKFVHYYDAWNYDKNESSQLDPEALADHHFIIVGDYKEDVKQKATKVFGKSHRQYFGVETFDKLHMVKSKKFPYYWPILKFKDKLVVMRRKGDA